jgi:membrane carboxypeptidase/penicillin-binding protein PbpC
VSRPSIAEVSALVADLAAPHRNRTSADWAALMDRKADLLERIVAHTPGDAETAEVARLARERADSLKPSN